MPALSEHVVMVNVGRPYSMEERLDRRAYRTSGVRGDVGFRPGGYARGVSLALTGAATVESFVMGLDPAFVRRTAAVATRR